MPETVISPSEIDEDSVVSPHAEVSTVTIDDRVVLVEGHSGQVHALNPTGSLVWCCLDGDASLGEIIDDLSQEFAIPRGDVATDVVRLVRGLGTLGYLQGVGRNLTSRPVRIELVGSADSGGAADGSAPQPTFDARYLAVPPNG